MIRGFFPFASSAKEQVEQFDSRLFHRALLADIEPGSGHTDPLDDRRRPLPLFVFNATNLQTGELWQLRSSAIGGPITHWTAPRKTLLSEAVAASSGFPLVLSPLQLDLSDTDVRSDWHNCSDFHDNPYGIAYSNEPGRVLPDDRDGLAAFRQRVYLVDRRVRDNLGIGTIEEINRLRRLNGVAHATATLISDGGATTALDAGPAGNWLSQSLRVLHLMSDQPDEIRVANIIRAGSLRLRAFSWQVSAPADSCTTADIPATLESARRRAGADSASDAYAYWSVRRRPKYLGFECPAEARWMTDEVRALSAIPTQFRAMPDSLQARLINWGYIAAHHVIPYVDYAWPDRGIRKRWLDSCVLPFEPAITDPVGDTPSAHDARCLKMMSVD
ncbi:hypothetical protein SAMN05444679_10385 [Variovorax sp. CF079]|nr:hypothetical protein SAMN05444679_10385 [Variovorax sp. CF079]